MVGLTNKLMEILELRKAEFTGQDIKHIVESILMAESVKTIEDGKQQGEYTEKLLKQWMVGGE